MSALDIFAKRGWFRRLWLLAVGILLGLGYFFDFLDDVYFTPALIGILIGLLSARILWGIINCLFVLFGMILSIVIYILSGNLGAGDKLDATMYRDLIASCFVSASKPTLFLVLAVFIGFVFRNIFLYLKTREKLK